MTLNCAQWCDLYAHFSFAQNLWSTNTTQALMLEALALALKNRFSVGDI
jgi:hypothetical protein